MWARKNVKNLFGSSELGTRITELIIKQSFTFVIWRNANEIEVKKKLEQQWHVYNFTSKMHNAFA